MNEKINSLRERLNNMLKGDKLITDDVLQLSEELDLLILEYYEEEDKDNPMEKR